MRGRPVASPSRRLIDVVPVVVMAGVILGAPLTAQQRGQAEYLADRGPGLPTSLFGTYVESGDFLVYPFYEYTKTSNFEYKASELGYVGEQDYLGDLVEHEYLLFMAYGISDRVAVELEGAVHARATFDRAPDDPTGVPAHLEESGLGDVEAQVRWRWKAETAHRPELMSFVEVVFPVQEEEVLIGTTEWEAAFGFGVLKGYRWGTIYGRVTLAYDPEDDKVEPGEFAFEYLKRTSSQWRFVAALEGESDELSVIGEAQWFFLRHAMLKLNCGFGVTEKAPDIAPEIGILFRF